MVFKIHEGRGFVLLTLLSPVFRKAHGDVCVCVCEWRGGIEMRRLNIILLRNVRKFDTEESLTKAIPDTQLFIMKYLNGENLKD